MLAGLSRRLSRERQSMLEALDRAQAVIELQLDGTVITANDNFLKIMGYDLGEIQKRHHSMFVDPIDRDGNTDQEFWVSLRRGDQQIGTFKRMAKNGREVWLDASYLPVLAEDRKPQKIVVYGIDSTRRKREHTDLCGQVAAINRSQAVIEFELDGTIITANQPFLDAVGYRIEDIKGRHHRMFLETAHCAGPEYEQFWRDLRSGDYRSGQFKRVGKNGKEVWIEASYNPVLDASGKPLRVIKFATDITAQIALLANLEKVINQNFGDIDVAMARSSDQITQAVMSVRDTSSNVQTMAASAEQLAASVRELAETMSRSKAAADSAHGEAVGADTAVRQLGTRAKSMEGITDLIRGIAGQINLLALNATIESARAGEAGKGFAVVASEVKNLAQQARVATDQISREIAELQTASGAVTMALNSITGSIENVRQFVTGSASAVQEQDAVTQDMSMNMQRAAASAAAVNDNMAEITTSMHQAVAIVGTTRHAAAVLAK